MTTTEQAEKIALIQQEAAAGNPRAIAALDQIAKIQKTADADYILGMPDGDFERWMEDNKGPMRSKPLTINSA